MWASVYINLDFSQRLTTTLRNKLLVFFVFFLCSRKSHGGALALTWHGEPWQERSMKVQCVENVLSLVLTQSFTRHSCFGSWGCCYSARKPRNVLFRRVQHVDACVRREKTIGNFWVHEDRNEVAPSLKRPRRVEVILNRLVVFSFRRQRWIWRLNVMSGVFKVYGRFHVFFLLATWKLSAGYLSTEAAHHQACTQMHYIHLRL